MTSREALAVGVVAAPALGAVLVALAPRRAVTAVATGAALVTCALALALAAVALADPGDPFVGDWLVVDAAAGLLVGVIGAVGLASVLVSPAYLGTAQSALVGPERRTRTYYAAAARVLGDPARRPARRQSRRRLAARRGDDGGLRGAGRLQRAPAGARGGLEVPDPDLARPRRSPCSGSCSSPPGRPAAGSRRSPGRRCGRTTRGPTRRSSPTCCCSPASRRRSAGRRCTTGFRTRTRRPRRPSRRSSPPRSFLRCCSSPGARSSRSRRSSGRRRRRASSSASVSSRSPSRCRSSGGRWPGSGCSPTRASSTWA